MTTPARPTTGFAYLDDADGVIAFAHRGGALHPDVHGLENTMVAFEHAVGLGYRYLETDVHATSDGVLVAFHDESLDRMTDSLGLIRELLEHQVADARIAGEHGVPTMATLLEHFPDTRFNVDLKAASAVEPMVDLLRRTNAHDRVLIGAFSERVMRDFRRRVDRPVATACGVASVVAARFLPFLAPALRPLLRDSGVALQVPHHHLGTTVLTPELVRRAHAAGRHVHAWTIDDPEEIRELLDMGVDGIFTDRTDLLREVLIERGLWRGSSA